MDSSERIKNDAFRRKVTDADSAAAIIKDGMTVAMSGFTSSGYPKEVPIALARRIKATGETCRIAVLTGASTGDELDGELSRVNAISRRAPYQTNSTLRDQINAGSAAFSDIHLGEFDMQVRRGFFGQVDVGVVEATAITADGGIIPTTAVGNAPSVLQVAKEIVIEVNEGQPAEFHGFHDVFMPGDPPHRRVVPITSPGDIVGTPYMSVDPTKVKAVVVSSRRDSPRELDPPDSTSVAIALHLVEFLKREVKRGALPKDLLPVQSGVGSIANSVLKGFMTGPFEGLQVYSEVIQDGVVDLLDSGKVAFASGTALACSPSRMHSLLDNLNSYRGRIILRPQEITNSAEVISRLGVIAINTAVEVDIYGNVNSTHTLGTKMINGLGGSGDFARNAYLSIFCTPSERKNVAISCVVPFASHVDHTEHDVDIIVTEQGVADLRGLGPRERAKRIIDNCAHPAIREPLREYWAGSEKLGGHYPVDLSCALSWHSNLTKYGAMVPKK